MCMCVFLPPSPTENCDGLFPGASRRAGLYGKYTQTSGGCKRVQGVFYFVVVFLHTPANPPSHPSCNHVSSRGPAAEGKHMNLAL